MTQSQDVKAACLSGQNLVRQLGEAELSPKQARRACKQPGPSHGGAKLFASDSEGRSVKRALLPAETKGLRVNPTGT